MTLRCASNEILSPNLTRSAESLAGVIRICELGLSLMHTQDAGGVDKVPELEVAVYSGTEKVQLFLNGKLIGEKPTGRDQEFKAVFSVPYTPGTLKAVGIRGGRAVAESVLTTARKLANLRVTAGRAVIAADGQDLSFIQVEAVDPEGAVGAKC
jgi:hypothetical protein